MGPVLGTSFVGRDAELDDLTELLETRSLVTIVGEGGVGKTRLAREVADALATADWPVWWVDLGSTRDAPGVRSAFEDALRPVGADGSFEELIEGRVPHGRCLIALDNCEHVLDDIACRADQIATIRPEARLLATSRTRLGIVGEVAYRLDPLVVPPTEAGLAAVADVPSARLLVDRVRDVVSDFELDADNAAHVIAIARRTEGVPLAIELVAAAAGVLPLRQIATDMPDTAGIGAVDARREPRRHRSLDASARWSVDRLDAAAGTAFRRLGAFADSFRFDSAVRVISDRCDRGDRSAVRAFVELVEASLVRRLDEDRYSLPMAVRTLAADELEADGEAGAVRDRHADVVADLIGEAIAGLRAADDADDESLRMIDVELPEIRSAINWQLSRDRPGRAADLVLDSYDHAHLRGRYGEVFAQCRTILAHPGLDRAHAARLASVAALIAVMAGRLADGYDFAVRAVSSSDDPVARGHAQTERAWSGFYSGRSDAAEMWSDLDDGLRIAQEHRDDDLYATALQRKGSIVVQARSIAEGRALLESVAADDSRAAHQVLASRLFRVYGTAVFDLELDTMFQEVVAVIDDCRATGHVAYETMALATAGTVAALWGDEHRSDGFHDRAEHLAREHDLPTFRNLAQRWRAFAHYRFERPDVVQQAERAIALAAATDNVWDEAAARWLLGLVLLRADDDASVDHLQIALEHSAEPGYPFSRTRAELALAIVDLRNGEFGTGLERIHEALRAADDYTDRLGVAAALDHLALFESERDALDRAGRFAGAADAVHMRSRVPRLPFERDLRAEIERRLVERHPDEAASSIEDGRALGLHAAVRLAQRSRGRRGRPVSGWESLTPTEAEVAGLAAAGLSNPAIANRLVMSVNTVKTHLSHVYAKTGVEGRASLAAEWARRAATS